MSVDVTCVATLISPSRSTTTPVPKQQSEVGAINHAIAIKISDRRTRQGPCGQEKPEVRTIDAAIKIQITSTQLAFIRNAVAIHIRDTKGDVA